MGNDALAARIALGGMSGSGWRRLRSMIQRDSSRAEGLEISPTADSPAVFLSNAGRTPGQVFLLGYLSPAEAIAGALSDRGDPFKALAVWKREAESLRAALNRNPEACTLVHVGAAISDPDRFRSLIALRTGVEVGAPDPEPDLAPRLLPFLELAEAFASESAEAAELHEVLDRSALISAEEVQRAPALERVRGAQLFARSGAVHQDAWRALSDLLSALGRGFDTKESETAVARLQSAAESFSQAPDHADAGESLSAAASSIAAHIAGIKKSIAAERSQASSRARFSERFVETMRRDLAQCSAALVEANQARLDAEDGARRARDELTAKTEAVALLHAELQAERRRILRLPSAKQMLLRLPVVGAMIRKIALRRNLGLLRGSDLFDADWYREKNADVAASGVDPAQHYLLYGGVEGRAAGPKFCSKAYLTAYPDVAESNQNPLIHYLKRGQAEGRAITAAQAPVISLDQEQG